MQDHVHTQRHTQRHTAAVTGAAVRVLLVAPDDLVTESIRRALAAESTVIVVGRIDTDGDLDGAIARHTPDVAVMTAKVHDDAGLAVAAHRCELHPQLPVVLLADAASGPALVQALAAGCAGFVSWDGTFTELVRAVSTAAEGGVHVPSAMAHELATQLHAPTRSAFDLTQREQEVLALLAGGRSTDEIMDELTLSVHTVRNHVRAILAKLGAHSRLEAVAIATRRGLASAPAAPALR